MTDTPAPYLTLRRLWVWLEEPAARLRMAAALADAVAELPGGHLLRAAFAAAHHGQATMRATVCLLPQFFAAEHAFVLVYPAVYHVGNLHHHVRRT